MTHTLTADWEAEHPRLAASQGRPRVGQGDPSRATCTLHVERELRFREGDVTRQEFSHSWPMTAVAARKHRVARFRAARADYRVEGDVIVVVTDKGEFVETERLRFVDDEVEVGEE